MQFSLDMLMELHRSFYNNQINGAIPATLGGMGNLTFLCVTDRSFTHALTWGALCCMLNALSAHKYLNLTIDVAVTSPSMSSAVPYQWH